MAKAGGAAVVTAEEFEQVVLTSEAPVLVDFFATWCGPCRALGPTLDELAGDLAGRARIVKIDVDEAPDLAQRHAVSSIPCLVLFKGGREVGRLVGAAPKRRIAGAVDQAIAA